MATALIGLGSNLGDRAANLNAALDSLRVTSGIQDVLASSFHETKPIGGPSGQEAFLNAAARFRTSLSPDSLLSRLHDIEHEFGRVRDVHWGARTLDLDLLMYDDVVLDSAQLVVPHPRLAFRRFYLEPAAEIAPNLLHPVLGMTVAGLLQHWKTAARYVAISGDEAGKYARLVQDHFGARLLESPLARTGLNVDRPAFERELWRLAQLLATSSWPQDSRLVVSDFYLDALADVFHQGLSPGDRELWQARLDAIRAETVRPRLLIVGEYGNTSLSTKSKRQMPFLRINLCNPAMATNDLLAAIESSL